MLTSVQRHVPGAGPVLLLLLQHACVSPSCVDPLDAMPDLVLAHVNIVAVDAGYVLRDRTVSIAGRHIVSVLPYPDTALPPDVRVIDATGRYLLPGLWNIVGRGTRLTLAPAADSVGCRTSQISVASTLSCSAAGTSTVLCWTACVPRPRRPH